MSEILTPISAFVYMKVGDHAREDFNSILQRKNKESESAGLIFWGYGGTACHPIKQVQPFAKSHIKQENRIYLYMEPISSQSDQDYKEADEYSPDGINWSPIPKGVRVTGSRYALVLNNIEMIDLELSLDDYLVGIGPSTGKPASQYIQGRTDKGCLVRSELATNSPHHRKKIKFAAKLKSPFAVLLR